MLIDRLVSRIKELAAPIVVGLDPRLEQIPNFIKEESFAQLGQTPPAVSDVFFTFNKAIIDSVCDIVPAVKPQIAMYERFGPAGLVAYVSTVAYAKSKGLIVIGDVKRGDIGPTAEAYSAGHIGESDASNKADFITVNPYMGFDSIEPYLADCKAHDKGLFVLVKTSNKGSRDIQDIVTSDGRPLYSVVGGLVSEWGAGLLGKCGYSAIGAVVGATHPAEAKALRKAMPHTFFLVPGYGAQGGSGEDLKELWDGGRYGAIVNSSRGITAAYKSKKFHAPDKDFALAAREAALDMKKDLEIRG